jgi:hypothetical protein
MTSQESVPQIVPTILTPGTIRTMSNEEIEVHITSIESMPAIEWGLPVYQRRLSELNARKAELGGEDHMVALTREYYLIKSNLQHEYDLYYKAARQKPEPHDNYSLRMEASVRMNPNHGIHYDKPIDGIYVDFLTVDEAKNQARNWDSNAKAKVIEELKRRQELYASPYPNSGTSYRDKVSAAILDS